MKSIAARRPRLSTTWKTILGLTLFYFIAKSIGHR